MWRLFHAAFLTLILISYPASLLAQEKPKRADAVKTEDAKRPETLTRKSGDNLRPKKTAPEPAKPKGRLDQGRHTLAAAAQKEKINQLKQEADRDSRSAEEKAPNSHDDATKETEEKHHERPGPCEEYRKNQMQYKKCLGELVPKK